MALTCNKGAAGQICGKPVDVQQHHCCGCRYGGGVDRWHAEVARCLADMIHSHNGTKVYIEQVIPSLTRVVDGQPEHARMDLVFSHNGTTTYLDVAIVSTFSSNPALIATASNRPGHVTKRAEKANFDRYPHISLAPFILEITARTGQHAKKFISNLMKDADNPSLTALIT